MKGGGVNPGHCTEYLMCSRRFPPVQVVQMFLHAKTSEKKKRRRIINFVGVSLYVQSRGEPRTTAREFKEKEQGRAISRCLASIPQNTLSCLFRSPPKKKNTFFPA